MSAGAAHGISTDVVRGRPGSDPSDPRDDDRSRPDRWRGRVPVEVLGFEGRAQRSRRHFQRSGDGADEFEGYGDLWWVLDDGDYMALGSYGQWIVISPRTNSVVVLLGAVPRHPYMSPEELALHGESSHLGSVMRKDFARSVAQHLVRANEAQA